MSRPRSTPLFAALTGLLASLMVLFAATPEADACSIAPPQLEVWPQSGVQPGDALKVRGTGFHDAIWHDVAQVDPATGAVAPQRVAPAIAPPIEPNTCAGLELVPQVVVLSWIGPDEVPLRRVMGPDFELELRVPEWARPGWAAVSANGVLAEVKIGDGGPEPCPLAGADVDPARWPDHCPKPCPELFDATGRIASPPCPDPCDVLVRPATGAGERTRWCPEPCPVHAQGAVSAQVLPPDCPDPCANAAANAAVWCPPPCPAVAAISPNPVTEDEWRQRWPHCPWPCEVPYDAHSGDAARAYWPCPQPCPAVADLDPAQVTEEEWKRRLPHCPWPCDLAAGVALSWWPCPQPCPVVTQLDATDAIIDAETWQTRWPDCPWPCPLPLDAVDGDLQVWPCPYPCPVHGHVDAADTTSADAEGLSIWCPDPCGWPYLEDGARPPVPADAEGLSIWCPDPCRVFPVDPATGVIGGDLLLDGRADWCPHPLPVPEPFPCAVAPDGTTWCEGDPVEPDAVSPGAATPGVIAPAAAADLSPMSSSPSWQAAAVAAAPPAPRIDFDGCRVDGPSPCIDVVYARAVQTVRRILSVLPGR